MTRADLAPQSPMRTSSSIRPCALAHGPSSRLTLVGLAAAAALFAPRLALADEIDATFGNCPVVLMSSAPWTGTGTQRSTTAKTIHIRPKNAIAGLTTEQLKIPLYNAGGFTNINPNAFTYKIEPKTYLPIPNIPLLSDLLAAYGSDVIPTLGIVSGSEIQGTFPVNPAKSYFYFKAAMPFEIELSSSNSGEPDRTTTAKNNSSPSLGFEPGLAFDPCDPLVLIGGVSVTIELVTVTLDAIGFSYKGDITTTSKTKVWNQSTNTYAPYVQKGHVYQKAAVSVGLGKSGVLSLVGDLAITLNLDPKGNGLWGLKEAVALITKGKAPTTFPDFQFMAEGTQKLSLPLTDIDLNAAVVAVDAADPKNAKVQFGGTRGAGLSVAQFFPAGSAPPGSDLLRLNGSVQAYGNATFDLTKGSPNGTYGIKLRGEIYIGALKIDSDVDVTYDGRVHVCTKLPGTSTRLCDKELEDGVLAAVDFLVGASAEAASFFSLAGAKIGGAFKDAAEAVAVALTTAGHNLHSHTKCMGEAKTLGEETGSKLLGTASSQASSLISKTRTSLTPAGTKNYPSVDLLARAVNPAFEKLYGELKKGRNTANAEGRDVVEDWSLNATHKSEMREQFTTSLDSTFAGLEGALNDTYKAKVGRTWKRKLKYFNNEDRAATKTTFLDTSSRKNELPRKFLFGGSKNHLFWVNHTGELWHTSLTKILLVTTWVAPNRLGTGWGGFRHVFGGHNGIIYAITKDGTLYRYRFDPSTWAFQRKDQIGAGWNTFSHVTGGKDGLIYAVRADTGKLRYFRDIFVNGSSTWGPNTGQTVALGFSDFRWVVGGDDGYLYALDTAGDLYLFRDPNRDGTYGVQLKGKLGNFAGYTDFAAMAGGGLLLETDG